MAATHHSSAHRRAAAALRARGLQPCCLCGQPIDYTARAPHPASFSAEHWPPISVAGEHHNLAPAHLGCQRIQGGLLRAGQAQQIAAPSSGVWD